MLRPGRIAAGKGCEEVLALILASGRGRALEGLTAWQTKAAVPFAGQYRIVDFVLSNCVNSEIRRIALLTQYKSQSLIRHVHAGWGFLHRELGEFVEIWPAQQQDGERWYRGTVDAVYQNTDLIEATAASHVLVLGGDQIYALDYGLLIELHAAQDADLTIACAHVPDSSEHDEVFVSLGWPRRANRAQASVRCGAEAVCASRRWACSYSVPNFSATAWRATPSAPPLPISRATSCRRPCARRACLRMSAIQPEAPHYWRTLNTVDRYWHAHMELLDNIAPPLHADGEWPVFTRHEPLSPARVLTDAYVDAAVVSPGAVVAGDVTRSVISTRCRIGANAVVRDSVLLPGAVVGDGCILDKVIVDSDAALPRNTMLGTRLGTDSRYYASPEGIVLATSARHARPFDIAARAIA